GRDADRVHGPKDEDEGEGRARRSIVVEDGVAVIVDARLRLYELGRGNGHAEPDDAAARERKEEQRPAADLVDEGGAEDGEEELLARVDEVNVGLLDMVRVTRRVEHGREEV